MSIGPEDLSEKLKSLGVQVGAKNLQPPPPQARPRTTAIEEVVQGANFETRFGPVFLSEQVFPSGYRHGSIDLCSECPLEALSAWGAARRLVDPALRNVLFLDTETTGLMGGAGTLAFLAGLGYHDGDGFHVAQFFLRDPAEEPAFLSALERWAARFDVIVTFNGKTFDLPLLAARCTLNQFEFPYAALDHLDLLHLARKLWRDRLASRALVDLEKEIVRFQRSRADIPGWMIPELYFAYLRSGDAAPLAGVFYHNAMDILSMAALFHHVAALLTEPASLLAASPWVGDGAGLDLAAVARLYEDLGWLEKAAQLYEASLDHGLPEAFFFKTIQRYAHMERRQGRWEQAARLWERAAERGLLEACVELAKYYEHHARDYDTAQSWVQRAVRLVPRAFPYEYARRHALQELAARAERLYKKKGVRHD